MSLIVNYENEREEAHLVFDGDRETETITIETEEDDVESFNPEPCCED